MTKDEILSMAREAGATPYTNRHYPDRQTNTFNPEQLGRFAALVAKKVRESFIAEIQAQIDHAVMNDLRLTPNFGKKKGDLAVRVGSIEAALDAIRGQK
jgi:hypothetical protein